jgi:hypothetical protein
LDSLGLRGPRKEENDDEVITVEKVFDGVDSAFEEAGE